MIIKVSFSYILTCNQFLAFQDHPKAKDVISKSRGYPRKRLVHMYDLCRAKKVCEGGEELDSTFDASIPQREGEEPEEKKPVSVIFLILSYKVLNLNALSPQCGHNVITVDLQAIVF